MDREKLIQEARKYRNLSKLIERNITEPELMTDFHILKSAPLLKRIEELEKALELSKSSDTEKARELLGGMFGVKEIGVNEGRFISENAKIFTNPATEKEQAEFICSLLNKAQGYEY